jgi:hypothetical protein
MKMIVEMQMECRLAGEAEVPGENLPQRHFCPSQNPTWPDPGLNPGRRSGKPATNRLSYGAALMFLLLMESNYQVYRWDAASNRNEYQESLKISKPGGKVRPARRADNLAAISRLSK